jgi:hypothetical protein
MHLELMLPDGAKHLDVVLHGKRTRTDRYHRRRIKQVELTFNRLHLVKPECMKNRLHQGHYVASTGHTRLPSKRAVKILQKETQEQAVQPTNNRGDSVINPCLIRRI